MILRFVLSVLSIAMIHGCAARRPADAPATVTAADDGPLAGMQDDPEEAALSLASGQSSVATSLGARGRDAKVIVDNFGTPHVFLVTNSWGLRHMYQVETGAWKGEDMPGRAHALSVVKNKDGRLEVFYIGLGGVIYHQYQNKVGDQTSWSGEARLGGEAFQIEAIADGQGRVALFHIGMGGGIYQRYQVNAGDSREYTKEAELKGSALQIAVARDGEGKITLFHVGLGPNITGPMLTQGFESAMNSIPFILTAGFSGSTLFSSLSQLVLGRDLENYFSNLYVQSQVKVGDFSNWTRQVMLEGKGRAIAAGRDRKGKISLFHVGQNSRIWRTQQSTNWGTAEEVHLKGVAGACYVLDNTVGDVDFAYISTKGSIYYNSEKIGAKAFYLNGLRDPYGKVHLAYVGLGGKVYYAAFEPRI